MKKLLYLFILLPSLLSAMEGSLRSAIRESRPVVVCELILKGAKITNEIIVYANRISHRWLDVELDDYFDGNAEAIGGTVTNCVPVKSDLQISMMLYHPKAVREGNLCSLMGQLYGIGGEYVINETDIVELQNIFEEAKRNIRLM